MNQNDDQKVKTDPSLVSITGGSQPHPIGTGVGAAGGAVVGAAMGASVGGPVGAVVGGAIGAAAGAMTGQSVAEAVNPTEEDAYWSVNFFKRDYVEKNRPYADYRSAFQYGWESRARMGKRLFSDVESDLERGWELAKGESKLAWAQAKHATSDAWDRIQ